MKTTSSLKSRFLLFAVLLLSGAVGFAAGSPFVYKFVNRLVDASDNGYRYSYAPAIVYTDGAFHMFYCSTGSNGGWDDIRYVTSTDGRVWSTPQIVLTTSDRVNERATCDPSVVRYQAPGDEARYFYLFYSGNKKDVQTAMFVARSETIAGPYAKWTTSGTWENDAPNPQVIIGPSVPKPDKSGWYGAGQQSVVVRDGSLVSWYTDDTTCSAKPCVRTFTSTSTSPTSWPVGTPTNVNRVGSVDVKYDPAEGQYVMFLIGSQHQKTSYLVRRFSLDGVVWQSPEVLCDEGAFPDWAHNPGVSADATGALIAGRALVAHGAPYDLDPSYDNDCTVSPKPHCWGYWDLYGGAINPRGQVWNDIPWGWRWAGMGAQHRLALGDYDGDGKTDRAIVDFENGRWYMIASSGASPIPWGWRWTGMGAQHQLALGDYDGDGKTDRAIVNSSTSRWYVISSSAVEFIPWGWKWPEMGPQHQLALGDYDGDGKTDRAIVDPNIGQWYVITSTGAEVIPWGWKWPRMRPQYQLALGDYDGDGLTDRAIVSPASGRWYVLSSSGVEVIPWGWQWPGMRPQHTLALGDYDGDGKTDRAITAPANGRWFVMSSTGANVIPWGWKWSEMGPQHELVLGDYDGDGRTDRAIVDWSTGGWFVLGSVPFEVY